MGRCTTLLTLGEPLATVPRAVVFLSRAEVLLYPVAGGSALLCAWHVFAFLKGASTPVKEDIARTHCEDIVKIFARTKRCDGMDAREPGKSSLLAGVVETRRGSLTGFIALRPPSSKGNDCAG
jgi:hypothetical protein